MGAFLSPGTGLPGGATPTAGVRRYTLEAKNLKCNQEAQKYMVQHQVQLEDILGLRLDDGEPMRATIEILQLPRGESTHELCFPHLVDVAGNKQWKAEVTAFGSKQSIPYIEMVRVHNPNDVELEVNHTPPGAGMLGWIIVPKGIVELRSSVGLSTPRNPNGTWEVAIANPADYARFTKHRLDYFGPPPVCVQITARCTEPTP